MTILDRIFGDDPKKRPVNPFDTIINASKDIGIQDNGMMDGLLKVATGNVHNIPKKVWINPDTGQPQMVAVDAFTPAGSRGSDIRRTTNVNGEQAWQLKMKDQDGNEFPYPVNRYTQPELFDLLQAGSTPQDKINELTSKIFGGQSTSPGGSPYGFEDGIDGGEIKQRPTLTTYQNNYIPKFPPQSTIQAGTETPFKSSYPDWKGEDVKLKDTKTPVWKELYKPFEWNEYILPSGKKRAGLLDMIQNFTENVRFKI